MIYIKVYLRRYVESIQDKVMKNIFITLHLSICSVEYFNAAEYFLCKYVDQVTAPPYLNLYVHAWS